MSKKITTGVEKAYFAILDNETGAIPVYKPVSYLQGLQEFSIVANEETASIYAENRLWENENALGEIEVTLTFTSIFTEDYVALLGKKLAQGGGVIETADDQAPYIALMLEKTLSGGVKEYLTLYKGRLRIPEDVARTKEGATEFQVKSLSGTFMALNNGIWKHVVKSDDPNFEAVAHNNTWGKTVALPEVLEKVATPITTTPAAAATNHPVGDNLTVTFPNALVSHEVTLVNNAQQPVAVTVSLDTAKKILTVNPNSNLTATTHHTLTVIAKDIFGEVINHTLQFRTA